MKQLILPIGIAIVVVSAGTWYQAILSERWTPQDSERLQQFTKCLDHVPIQIGNWEGTDDKIDPEEFKKTHCTAYVSRRYTNKQSGETVSMYLVSGTARHCTIHSPDWCYQGAGFKMQGAPENYALEVPGMTSPEFSTAVFLKKSDGLRIFWAYADNGEWKGPKWAKTALAGKPAMYKIYLIGPPTDTGESPVNAFARELFPKLDSILFSQPNDGQVASN